MLATKEGDEWMSIVMGIGIDQVGRRSPADWIDLVSGEVSRARVRPADRAGVRRFLGRFDCTQLEVALEATTGWRFFVGELRAAGAEVGLRPVTPRAGRR